MGIKSVYLDKKRLYELKDILYYHDTMLYLKLRDYLYNLKDYNNNFDGEFLINIFNDNELRKLSIIDSNCYLFDGNKKLLDCGVEYEMSL